MLKDRGDSLNRFYYIFNLCSIRILYCNLDYLWPSTTNHQCVIINCYLDILGCVLYNSNNCHIPVPDDNLNQFCHFVKYTIDDFRPDFLEVQIVNDLNVLSTFFILRYSDTWSYHHLVDGTDNL